MDEYVGCQIKRIHQKCIIIHQTDLLKKLERTFKTDIKDLKVRKMPLGTNNRIMKPKDDETLISSEEQTRYRSGIGMLLYLVKYSRPDLSNTVRELSKVNSGATSEHVRSLVRVIKFKLDTRNKGLVYNVAKKMMIISRD